MVFVGKGINNTQHKCISTTPGLLAGVLRMYIRMLGTGQLRGNDLRRLLGKLQWLCRLASMSPFLVGAYHAADLAKGKFTKALSCRIATTLMFSLLAKSFPLQKHNRASMFFVDTVLPLSAGNPLKLRIAVLGGGLQIVRMPALGA